MDVFLGTVMIFGGNFAPQGWAFCQGQLLPISQNAALYSLLGTFYGGNGTTTFALPNLQGRVAIGMGNGGALGTYTIGQMGGSPQLTLTINNLPSHTHTVNAQTESATNTSPANAFPAQPGSKNTPGPAIYGTSPNTTMASGMISATGGNQPASILPPYLALNYIIALQGIYPSRS